MREHIWKPRDRRIQICFRALPPEEELTGVTELMARVVDACEARQREGVPYFFVLDGATPVGGYIPWEHWGGIDCRREEAAKKGRELSVEDYLILTDEALVFYRREDPADRVWLDALRAAAGRMKIDFYPVALP